MCANPTGGDGQSRYHTPDDHAGIESHQDLIRLKPGLYRKFISLRFNDR